MTNQRLKGISGLICLKFSRGGFNAHKELTTPSGQAKLALHCLQALPRNVMYFDVTYFAL